MLKILIILMLPFYVWADTISGVAKSKSGMSYVEVHNFKYSDDSKSVISEINTDYKDKSGKIGFRQQVFTEPHYIPNTVFKDLKHNDTYSITVNGKLGILKTYFNGKEKTLEFNIKADYVTTASISKFIFENFKELLEKPMNVHCLIPKSLRLVKLRIRKESQKNSPKGNNVTFVVEPSSFLIKWLASKTYITFNMDSKKWVKYRGFSNLKNEDGESPKVIIKYQSKK